MAAAADAGAAAATSSISAGDLYVDGVRCENERAGELHVPARRPGALPVPPGSGAELRGAYLAGTRST